MAVIHVTTWQTATPGGPSLMVPLSAVLRETDLFNTGRAVPVLWLYLGADSVRLWPADPTRTEQLAADLMTAAAELRARSAAAGTEIVYAECKPFPEEPGPAAGQRTPADDKVAALEAELRWIDDRLARRPALSGTRAERIEKAIAVAAVAERAVARVRLLEKAARAALLDANLAEPSAACNELYRLLKTTALDAGPVEG